MKTQFDKFDTVMKKVLSSRMMNSRNEKRNGSANEHKRSVLSFGQGQCIV